MTSNTAWLLRTGAMISLLLAVTLTDPLYGQKKSGGMTLQGGVDHSDLLPPVPDELKAGAVFKDSSLNQVSADQSNGDNSHAAGFDNERFVDSEWYRVPPWLAGAWQKQTVTRYYRIDYHSGNVDTNLVKHTDISTFDYGYLPDSKGDIWDTPLRAATIRSDFGPTIGLSHITSNKIVSSTDNQIVTESKGTLTVIDKKTKRILSTHQCEAIRTLTLIKEGLIAEDSSQKDFDQEGHPLFLEKTKFASARSAPFDPSTGIADKHLVWLFGQFLLHNYWNDLLPGYYPSTSATTATP